MHLTVLGSAAAEGWPAIFCRCQWCAEARRRGGKDLRRRTTYQLGETIQVDFGPDAYGSALAFGLDYSLLRHLFVTHVHQDHWSPQELLMRREGFARELDHPLVVHGNPHVQLSLEALQTSLEALQVQFEPAVPYETVELGEGWAAVALPASHSSEDELALNYLFTWQGRNILIGNDTGWWLPEVWDYLQDRPLHVVVLDCTAGSLGPGPRDVEKSWIGSHHLNCAWVVEARDELGRRNALAPDHQFIANHFSHNGHWLHDDLEAYFVPQGIAVGYDGMRVPIGD